MSDSGGTEIVENEFDDMRKLLVTMILLAMPVLIWGQAQINTKKVKISDFTQKITKVVLSGNDFQDVVFKDEIAARWRISPYEFCTRQEFDALKGSDRYYFLLNTRGQFKKENSPGLMFLTLVKGGEGAQNGINDMLEVVSIPYAAAEDPSGRELVFLPAIIDIIQAFTRDSMEKDSHGYAGLFGYSRKIAGSGNMNIVFSEGDLSEEITREVRDKYFSDSMYATDETTADEMMAANTENTLVSYTVAPSSPEEGSFCYKMLFNAENGELYYFRKHRIGKKLGTGFLLEDIRRIAEPRR